MVKCVLEIEDVVGQFYADRIAVIDEEDDDAWSVCGKLVWNDERGREHTEYFGFYKTMDAAVVAAHDLCEKLRENCLINETQDEDLDIQPRKLKVYVRSCEDDW